jgi:hypothetical protein
MYWFSTQKGFIPVNFDESYAAANLFFYNTPDEINIILQLH